MERRYAGTMTTKGFMTCLACGLFGDSGDQRVAANVVVVATSYHDDAGAIREAAERRGLASNILVCEFDDVSNPARSAAIAQETANGIYGFLISHNSENARYLFVCDGAVSRSAAMLCAWMRLSGDDDMPVWANARDYSPNVLVYSRILFAGGIRLSETQTAERELLKDTALRCKVSGRKFHAMHLHGEALEQISDGTKCCELRKLDAKRRSVSPGDLIAFSQIGCQDKFLVARVTECRITADIEKLLLDRDILKASGFRLLEDAVAGMNAIYGSDSYEAVGIFLDVSDWIRRTDAGRPSSRNLPNSKCGSAVVRDCFLDGMK